MLGVGCIGSIDRILSKLNEIRKFPTFEGTTSIILALIETQLPINPFCSIVNIIGGSGFREFETILIGIFRILGWIILITKVKGMITS